MTHVFNDPSELHQALLAAHADRDISTYVAICNHNKSAIYKHFPAWMVLPYAIKDDDRRVRAYANAIIGIAEYFARQGDPKLMDLLNGEGENPTAKWDDAFLEFENLMKKFDFAAASELLQDTATQMRELSGPAVEFRLPYVHERLTWLFFLSGDLESAELYGRAALAGFRKTGNQEGILTICRRLADIFKASGDLERSKEWIIRFTNLLLQAGKKENAMAVRRLHGIQPLDQVISLSRNDD